MKLVSKEVKNLIVDKAKIITSLKNVNINGTIGTLIFRTFSTADTGFVSFGYLPFERYFLEINRGTDNIITFEFLTKQEGNSLYTYVKDTRCLSIDLDVSI